MVDMALSAGLYQGRSPENDSWIMAIPPILSRIPNKKPACTLFLSTYGGEPNSGYRVSRLLQANYANIRFVIPYMCKSTGTLMAIGAHELAMNDRSEFGPLDIQVQRKDEFSELSSSLDLVEAMRFIDDQMQNSFAKALINIRVGARISTKLCGNFATQMASAIAAPLYSQIDPQRLGELQRAMNITNHYGLRLLKFSKAMTEENLNKLVTSYPAHSFVIDKEEAKMLFTSVRDMNKQEVALTQVLTDLFLSPERRLVDQLTEESVKNLNGFENVQHLFNEQPENQQQLPQQAATTTENQSTTEQSPSGTADPIPGENRETEKELASKNNV